MKRVLVLSMAYLPRFIGGAEVAIKEITDRLAGDDFSFDLITPRYDSTLPREEQVGRVTVHRVGFTRPRPSMEDLRRFPLYWNKPLFQLIAVWKALRLHRRLPFDILWAMMAQSTGVAAGLIKTVVPDIRYILNLQEGDPPEYIETLMRPFGPLFRRAFTKADVVQSISRFLQSWAERMGATGKRVILPNGVDSARFSKVNRADTDQWTKRLDVKAGETWMVTTSRLVQKNAVDVCIAALGNLPENIHLAIAGIGPDEAALRALARSQNLTNRVHFLGEVSQEQIPGLLSACHVFVRPSRSEGLGISFLEAMAAGLPVIATQEGGIRDFLFDAERDLDHPTTGWAVDRDDPAQVATAVQRILSHPEHTKSVVLRAQKMVYEMYAWDTIAERMKQESFLGL